LLIPLGTTSGRKYESGEGNIKLSFLRAIRTCWCCWKPYSWCHKIYLLIKCSFWVIMDRFSMMQLKL
jgi:hypothetical protein